MLERIDRVQLVVADRTAAAASYVGLLGAEVSREDRCDYLSARRTVLALGESEVELCEPDGAGRAQRHLDEQGAGLFAAGASTRDLDGLAARRPRSASLLSDKTSIGTSYLRPYR